MEKTRFNLTIDSDLLKDLRIKAIELGVDVSSVITIYLTSGIALEEYENKYSLHNELAADVYNVKNKYGLID